MPRYLFQGQADSSGQTGPTLQRLADRAEVDRIKRTSLESLFETVAPMALYSGEAEAALRPSFLGGTRKLAILDRMKNAGASERQIFDALKMVFDGKGYNHFTDDALKLPKHGIETVKPLSSVSNVPSKQSIGVFFKKDLPENVGGFVSKDRMYASVGKDKASKITINSNLDDLTRTNSLGHELQHVLDMNVYNRSSGTSPNIIPNQQLDNLNSIHQSKFPTQQLNNEDIYYHNLGEIRGRLNGLLQTEPEKYTGLSSVFDGQIYNPELIWE